MGIRTGNPDWNDGASGGTPITAAALDKIEAAIDNSASLVDGKVPLTQLPPLGSGTGSGNALFVYYRNNAWDARPDVTTPVMYISTNDATAIRAVSMQNYDMWIRHPDALEAL